MAKNTIKVEFDFPTNILDAKWLELKLDELFSAAGIGDAKVSREELKTISEGLADRIKTELVISKQPPMTRIKNIKNNAFWRMVDGFGYNYSVRKTIWKSKKCAWNWLALSYGIRNSDKAQYFPIWNTSNNCERSLLFGFRFWYIQVTYHKKGKSFQNKWFSKYLPFHRRAWRLYNLIF